MRDVSWMRMELRRLRLLLLMLMAAIPVAASVYVGGKLLPSWSPAWLAWWFISPGAWIAGAAGSIPATLCILQGKRPNIRQAMLLSTQFYVICITWVVASIAVR